MKNNKNIEYQKWLSNENIDEELKKILLNFDQSKIDFAFKNKLEFGTAGIRGILGPGPGMFNIFTIWKVTRAYVKLLHHKISDANKEISVIIGHDNRHKSKEFAQEVAKILSSYDVKAILFKNNEMRPTPVVSFLTKKLKCDGGIVITASHNPMEYNGYKIYDNEGCQLIDEDTKIIAEYMKSYEDILDWKYLPKKSNIVYVTENEERKYDEMIENLQFYKSEKKNFEVIYSAVNGTGSKYVKRFLKNSNYKVNEVKEHDYEDPNFTNVGNPNPEFESAWKIPFEYAEKSKFAQIIIMTDPDADRLGVAVKHNNKWIRLNGNQTGSILIDWKLSQLKLNKKIPQNPALYSSFVTSDLGDRIAEEKYGVKIIKTLTGFKWMASEILKEKERNLNFVFAYEESYGYVIDSSTKDKDGIQAAMSICEAAWFYKTKYNKTLIDYLNDLYNEFDYYYTETINLNFLPNEIEVKLKPIMNTLRSGVIKKMGNIRLTSVEDYKEGLYNMPEQDLLKFYFEDKSWFAIRPSGTEPKIKIYFAIVGNDENDAKEKYENFVKDLAKIIKL